MDNKELEELTVEWFRWSASSGGSMRHRDAAKVFDALRAERDALRKRVATLEAAMQKVSDIRDGIVGMQGFNFSEHAYPLVAVLNAAGFKGRGYKISRQNLGTLIEQRDEAVAALRHVRALLPHGLPGSMYAVGRDLADGVLAKYPEGK